MAPSGYPGKREENHLSVSRFPSPDFILDGISALVDNSLLRLESESAGEPRYQMLGDCTRIRGRAAGGEQRIGRGRPPARRLLPLPRRTQDADVFLHAEPSWSYRLDRDLDNIRAAFDCSTRPPIPMDASALPAQRALLVRTRTHPRSPNLPCPGLAIADETPTAARARALSWAGQFAITVGEPVAADR